STRWRPTSSPTATTSAGSNGRRSEEHTSELQSRRDLVCRLLLEKKNNKNFLRGVGGFRKWFRFPALNKGQTREVRDRFRGFLVFFLMIRGPPRITPFPCPSLFR